MPRETSQDLSLLGKADELLSACVLCSVRGSENLSMAGPAVACRSFVSWVLLVINKPQKSHAHARVWETGLGLCTT